MTQTPIRRTLAATAVALFFALPNGAEAQIAQTAPQGPGGLTAALPDIVGTTLGFVMKSGPVPWGATVELKPHQADATQVGPKKDLCRFFPGAYRTHNKGGGNAGAFVNKVYRGSTLIHTHNVPGGLPAFSGLDWHKFTVDLKEGMNTIRVVFDANKQVSETNEANSFAIKVKVSIDCNGDGKIGGVAVPHKTFKTKPSQHKPDTAKPRKLRLQPRN